MNASQWFPYSNGRLILLIVSIFHRLPLFRQTPVLLGRSSKTMCIAEPESRNHFAIDSLQIAHFNKQKQKKCNNHRVNKKWKKKKRLSWLTTILSSYSVQSESSFRRHFHWILGKTMDFSDKKQTRANRPSCSEANWRVVHAKREPDLHAV